MQLLRDNLTVSCAVASGCSLGDTSQVTLVLIDKVAERVSISAEIGRFYRIFNVITVFAHLKLKMVTSEKGHFCTIFRVFPRNNKVWAHVNEI